MRVERRMRQGCVLSRDLFSLYNRKVMVEISKLEGMQVGGRNVNCIKNADYTVLIAVTNPNLQEFTTVIDEECRKGLRINFANTEVMGITNRRGRVDVQVDLRQRRVKQVDTIKNLLYTARESVN